MPGLQQGRLALLPRSGPQRRVGAGKEDLFRKALDRLSRKRRRLTERVWAAMDAALESAERDAAPGP